MNKNSPFHLPNWFETAADTEKVAVKIGVISDIHLTESKEVQKEETNLLKALLVFRQNGIDVLIVAGDIADAGEAGAYAAFSEMFERVFPDAGERPRKVFVMGNHDYQNGLTADQARQRFADGLGVKIDDSVAVKGYTFIGINTEDGELNGTFTDRTTGWLAGELEKASALTPDKPIFVAVHQPVTGTVFDNYGWSNPALGPVLKPYPQVIIFAGHTHFPLQDPRAIHQKDYTSVATASLSYAYIGNVEPHTLPLRGADKVAQGLLVTVDGAAVRVRRLDFHNNTMIETDWTIPLPISKSGFIYTDRRAALRTVPYFLKGSAIAVSEITGHSCTVTFPSAQHPDFVYSYKVQTVEQETGTVGAELYAFSDFYLGIPVMSPTQTYTLTGLKPQTHYEIRAVAQESYGLQSSPLTVAVTTGEEANP